MAAMVREKISHITIANRTMQPAQSLAEMAAAVGIPDAQAVTLADADRIAADCSVIVNATSIGLASNPEKIIPISTESINKGNIVYDIVYIPMKTDLIKKAREQGATCILGYEMLVAQAARSFEIWHGTEAPRDTMKRALLGVGV